MHQNFKNHSMSLRILIIGTLSLSVFVIYFLYIDAWPFIIQNRENTNQNYLPNFASLKLHVIGGSLMLALGLHQIASGWLGYGFKNHKVIGYIYLFALILALSGYSGLIGSTQLMSFKIGLSVLALIWVVTACMAYWAIRVKNILQHREWMMRNYAATTSFIVFRIFIENPDFKELFAFPGEFLGGAMPIAIAVPLLLTEVILQGVKIAK